MSSTDVKIFEKEEFGSVRVVMQGDDPWFVASDVAKSLGYDNPANAINTHCKKINKITLSPDLGGREISSKMPPVVMNIIPESDVYRLVMLDTGKLHSDGTPIRQLKWDTGVIPVIQNFLDAEIED